MRGATCGPAVEVPRPLLGDERLRRVRLLEEGLGLAVGFVDHARGDAVVRDVEEARVFGGVLDLRG